MMKTNMSIQCRNKYSGNLNINHVDNAGLFVMPKSLDLDFNEYWTTINNDYSTAATPSYKEIAF